MAQNVQAAQNAVRNDTNENLVNGERKNAFANLESEGTALPMDRGNNEEQANAVCPDPNKPCQHKDKEFADWELSFKLPARITANKTYSSAPFYAVMLKTYESGDDCDGGEYMESVEQERKQLQKSQPGKKVFAAYNCPNMDAVGYEFEGRWSKDKESMLIGNFIAVYAGQNDADAEAVLNSFREKYPKAVIKKMIATWERIEQ